MMSTFHCSKVNEGEIEPDAERNAFLLSRNVDTNFAYVTFSRPLDTSDVDDVVLDHPLYLHFGYSPSDIIEINTTQTSIWTSRSPIQFDCNRDGKNTFQPVVLLCALYAVH